MASSKVMAERKAARLLTESVEMNLTRKGQAQTVNRGDATGHVSLIVSLFGLAA